jgi:hypothetical protein
MGWSGPWLGARSSRACARDIGQPNATRFDRRKIARLVAVDVVADDTESLDAVMEICEARGLELVEAARNDAAKPPQIRFQEAMRAQGDAVHQNVTTTKGWGVIDHLLHTQPDRRVKRGENGARAHAGAFGGAGECVLAQVW